MRGAFCGRGVIEQVGSRSQTFLTCVGEVLSSINRLYRFFLGFIQSLEACVKTLEIICVRNCLVAISSAG
jgi:hypothetical protein